MVVTAVEQQKKNPSRYSVFIDGKFAFGMDGGDVLFYKITEGAELSQARYDLIRAEVVFTEAKNKAYRYIGYKARTEMEVRRKLTEKEFDGVIIEKTVNMLKEYNYLNDKEYAQKFIEYRLNKKGYGEHRIKEELRQRGVDPEITRELLAHVEYDKESIMCALIEKKFRNFDLKDEKNRQKVYNYLARRGYAFDDIHKVIRSLESGLDF